MKYKDGIILGIRKVVNGNLVELTPSLDLLGAMDTADKTSLFLTGKEIVITSVFDGVHSKDSLHYSGNAFDLRVWIYQEEEIKKLTSMLKSELGNNFDVVFEGDHIHVEYDQK